MIDFLIIRNYQSHRATRLRFVKGVNVFIGKSDKGKSAILRALNWAINNRPMPPKSSHWGGITSVEVALDNGKVVRKKDDKENIYRIDGKSLKAFGASVPDTVRDLFNMDEINIQGQHNAPFLINDSPGAVGKQLNAVADLDIIDISLSNIASAARKAEQEKGQGKQYLKELEADLGKYADIPAMERDLKAVEALAGQLSGIRDKEQGIRVLLTRITAVQASIDKYKDLDGLEAELLELDEKAELLQDKKDKGEDLSVLVFLIQAAKERAENIQYPTQEELLELTIVRDKLEDKSREVKTLGDLIVEIATCARQVKINDKAAVEFEKEYHELIPDVCPLCECKGECRGK